MIFDIIVGAILWYAIGLVGTLLAAFLLQSESLGSILLYSLIGPTVFGAVVFVVTFAIIWVAVSNVLDTWRNSSLYLKARTLLNTEIGKKR